VSNKVIVAKIEIFWTKSYKIKKNLYLHNLKNKLKMTQPE